MTNREKLLQEFESMDDRRLGRVLSVANVQEDVILTDLMCADCAALNGGECPHPDGDITEDPPCPDLGDWLGWPCRRAVILA